VRKNDFYGTRDPKKFKDLTPLDNTQFGDPITLDNMKRHVKFIVYKLKFLKEENL
jgi:hypothetical protein